MVSTTDKDNTTEDSNTEKKTSIPKVNILGVDVNLDTLAFVGTVLGLVGAGGTAWTIYNNWNKGPQQLPPPQQQPNLLAQQQYNEYVQAEMLRRQEIERQHNKQKKAGHESSDLSTIQPIVSNHQQEQQNVDYGRLLDNEKHKAMVPMYMVNQYQAPMVSESEVNPNARIDMAIYNKKRGDEEEEGEEELVDDQQQEVDPSIEELYKKANNTSYY